jgi:molecular chaperone HtpG
MKGEKWDEEKKEQVATDEDETVNQASALWARPKNDISDEQYKEFYKHVGHDFEDPLAWTHARVEGKPPNTRSCSTCRRARPSTCGTAGAKHGIKLYVRRVFIMDDAEQLMPTYLRFVRGVVDSADLPLNVSREILQESKDIEAIRKGCTAKVLGLLEDLPQRDAAEKEKYAKFWGEFGKVLKEGIGEDFTPTRTRSPACLRFASTHADTADETFAQADYIGRMKPEQEKIYYVTAETFNAAKNSPHLEVFRKKGIEVILLSDRVDEWVVSHLTEFEGKQLVSVAKGGLDLGKLEDEAEKKEAESAAGDSRTSPRRCQEPGRQGQGSARHASPDRQPGLPGGGRARRLRQPGAHPQGGRAEGAQRAAHPRNQSQAPGGAAPQVRGGQVRRLGGGAVRPGPAGRRRPARRSGHLRQAHES